MVGEISIWTILITSFTVDCPQGGAIVRDASPVFRKMIFQGNFDLFGKYSCHDSFIKFFLIGGAGINVMNAFPRAYDCVFRANWSELF
jgi:hypothetical protein